jgi:hypothetical protein
MSDTRGSMEIHATTTPGNRTLKLYALTYQKPSIREKESEEEMAKKPQPSRQKGI